MSAMWLLFHNDIEGSSFCHDDTEHTTIGPLSLVSMKNATVSPQAAVLLTQGKYALCVYHQCLNEKKLPNMLLY